ncbi:hypothetical protein W822_20790 [Advenella kashmirensis W13003]|uniref:Uncharacterized protein n=1 Tax=Advenella kashmirensis W13003 TaxID=1424334 RepID=V8QNS1_9BURK|nr:hypothetical protein W822_20790 [Advenella kashmirensis W13003]
MHVPAKNGELISVTNKIAGQRQEQQRVAQFIGNQECYFLMIAHDARNEIRLMRIILINREKGNMDVERRQ